MLDQVKLIAKAIEKIIKLQTKPVRYELVARGSGGLNNGVVLIEGHRSRILPKYLG